MQNVIQNYSQKFVISTRELSKHPRTQVVVDTANVSGGHTLPVALKTVSKSLPTEDLEGARGKGVDRQADGLRNSR